MSKLSLFNVCIAALRPKLLTPRTHVSVRNIFNSKMRAVCSSTRRLGLLLSLPFVPTVEAISFGFSKQKDTQKSAVDEVEQKEQAIISKADELYTESEVFELYDYLVQYKDSVNDEILWRLCRAAVDKSKHSQDKEVKKTLMYEAYEYIKIALELNDKNFACHKWYAIMLDYVGEYEGTKQRIKNAFLVKDHFQKALEFNPKDATTIHSLGYWCFVFADMPWYQQKIAAAIFSTPPTSTYDEALKFCLQAEEVDPKFYSMNLLLIGKIYSRQKNYKLALQYLTEARDYPVKTPDDEKAHKEAVDLLKSIGIKEDNSK